MVGWARGPGLPKKEGGEGLISEKKIKKGARGMCIVFFFSVHEYMHLGHVFRAITDVVKLT